MTFPFDWQPRVVSTQLATIGNIAIACVPGEFTTMSGRRVRDIVKETLTDLKEVIIAGLCNTYSDYITTYEEYQVGLEKTQEFYKAGVSTVVNKLLADSKI